MAFDTFKTYGGQDLTISDAGMKIRKPYLTYSWRDADLKKASTALWMPDATQCVTGNIIQATGGIAYNCQINRVCVGGRLRNGAPQVFSWWNRMYFGEIGEVLVFSRRLSDAERDAINAYLHNVRTGQKNFAVLDRAEKIHKATGIRFGWQPSAKTMDKIEHQLAARQIVLQKAAANKSR